ncbi:DNA ligase [Blastopirellula sp. JC732]|uniref:DNA ligase n=1 Tax=Blastopirellula sediminis TaxID=2894196 RepID=A0A9X1SH92_9BACT|nr:DNA ligase [Blastopirellula sediminis]MCC9606479.1 DNA ligase [Blastopirellula sediminis]MCC9630223.1 DNA ligase [Blastopirellula sediminis]
MADLQDGESVEMKGSGAKPYVLRNVGGVYSCTCPAWRNQSIAIETRTCKHLRKLRGDDAELARIGGALPAKPVKPASEKEGPPILLAQSWDNAADLSDWWMSEKLDGVRAYWDGEKFLSRQGNEYHAPDWFVAGFPSTPLDGELWIDRGKFQRTVSVVRRQDKSDHWREVRFLAFDAPAMETPFEERLEYLHETLRGEKLEFASVHTHERCTGADHLQSELARVNALGGEGLMLREPGSKYEIGRSFTLLKVKTFHDAEAIVIGHQPGKGKYKGRLGALTVQMPDGTEFSVGTGFSDAQRSNPPELGSVITYRFQELSDGGVPRFPSFVRLSEDQKAAVKIDPPAKKVAKAKPVAVAPAASSSGGEKRYFELVDGKSSKFWEIEVIGTSVSVRYGKIGANGTTNVKEFADEAAAEKQAAKLVAEKTGKGYEEK